MAVRTPAAAASEAGAVLSALVLADLLLDGGIVQGDDAETEASEVAASAQRRSERQPDPLDGLPIVRIVLVRRDIFDTNDPSTDAWPYRLANALHVTSTEAFVRRMLLFTDGDPYRPFAAQESERLLRGTGLVNPATITARRVEGGVEVTVETRDRFTLEVGGKLGLFGSRSDYGFTFDESNLLGNGWALGLRYRSNDERSSWTYTASTTPTFSAAAGGPVSSTRTLRTGTATWCASTTRSTPWRPPAAAASTGRTASTGATCTPKATAWSRAWSPPRPVSSGQGCGFPESATSPSA